MHLAPAVTSTIANYRSHSAGKRVDGFAREVVTQMAPASPARAKALLWACMRLAVFGQAHGLEPTAKALLRSSVVERCILVGTADLSPAARRTLHTNLRFLVARIQRGRRPGPTPLSRERAKAAYGEAEMGAYLALASAQPTLARRHRATGLICLGAGAGLIGADLRSIRGGDVICRSGGVVVVVGGARPRTVPVLARYHQFLLASADFAGSGYLIGRADPHRHNVTTPLVSSLSGGMDLPRLSTSRLRSTWLADCAEALGLKAFMEAAGIVCSQRLGDLVASLPEVDEERAVSLLGGRR